MRNLHKHTHTLIVLSVIGLLLSSIVTGTSTASLTGARSIAAGHTCTPPPPGLISWWPADGNADDIKGNNQGTLQNGAAFAPGMVDQAFSFDGFDDAVFVPHNPNLNFGDGQDFTLDAWINLQNPTAGHDDEIVDKINIQNKRLGVSPSGYRFFVTRDAHKIELQLISNGTTQDFVSNSSIQLNRWTHVTAIREGSTGRIYIDGVLDATATVLSGTLANSDLLSIGSVFDTLFNPPVQQFHVFGGLIDEVEIFNRALTASEIHAIFNAGSAGKCKPVTICHKPGTPAEKTLVIPQQALAGHLGHGDARGACR